MEKPGIHGDALGGGAFGNSVSAQRSRPGGRSRKRADFFKIVLPQLKPTLYTITVLSFLNSFKAFREAYLAAGSYPHESIYLLQHLFNNWYVDLALDKMAAAAVVTGAVLLLAILVWQRLWEENWE